MSDLGDDYAAMKAASKDKRASNRDKSAAVLEHASGNIQGRTVRARYMRILLPCLSAKMLLCGATNLSLATVSGVSEREVHRARNGSMVRIDLGLTMMQALNERKFTPPKRGRKPGHKDKSPRKTCPGRGKQAPRVLLPCLPEKMRAAGATNISLESASGVSTASINLARHGCSIRTHLAIALYDALNQREFTRCPQGRKY